MNAFLAKKRYAQERGWKVVDKEYYNPGGTTYRSMLVDPQGNERGHVDKYVKTRSLGKEITILAPDPDAEAWKLIDA